MKILKVALVNVKSYRNEVIHFHDGINVIAGRNGAGKSTLIEAIGLALFGYMNRDYNYQDFVSHGETSGKITVDFEMDSSRYQIERSFSNRGTKGWVIFDYQTDEIIETHSIEDVNFALSEILGLKEDFTLAELFERIIGVNQGTFTEPFLRSPGGRKEYFEKIFMLDSYKIAYQKSAETVGRLRQRCNDIEKELIKLRTRVEDYPKLKKQRKEEEEKFKAQKKLLKEKEKELQKVKERVQEFKKLSDEIQEFEGFKLQLAEQQKQLTERLTGIDGEIEISLKAKELVERFQSTYKAYLDTKEKIGNLEQDIEILEQINKEKQDLEKNIVAMSQRLKTEDENITISRKNLMNEYNIKDEELEEYSLPFDGIEKELKSVLVEIDQLEKVVEEISEITKGHQYCENLCFQLSERLEEEKKLSKKIEEMDQRLLQLLELEEEVAKILSCEKALEDVNHAISVFETQIFGEKENMGRVGDGLCPLLKTECKTIEGENLKDYFQNRVSVLEEKKAEKQTVKENLVLNLQTLREQAQKVATLKALGEERQRSQNEIELLKERGFELSKECYKELQQIYNKLNVIKKAGYLKGAGDLVFKDALPLELAQQYNFLNLEIDIVSNHLILSKSDITIREKLVISKKEELNQRKAELLGKISQIKERQKAINGQLEELTEVEKKLAKEKQILAQDQLKMDEFEEKLLTFTNVKGVLKEEKEKLDSLEEGNHIYLTNKQKADELINLVELKETLSTNLVATENKLVEVETKLDEDREKFDAEVLEELESQAEELTRQISQAEAFITEGERRLLELNEKLVEMDDIKAEIKILEKEESRLKRALNLMNFIRNIYNTSAEEIAQVFLRFISQDATKIYRQLSGENVQLIWENNYQVFLKDKHRTRTFKQLSGGEQMSAAFAIRLALLRKFSTIRLGFFDEPTTHLDESRRINIAQAIAEIREKEDNYFEQIFVISHDDTFSTLTENLIRVDKDEERGSYLVTD